MHQGPISDDASVSDDQHVQLPSGALLRPALLAVEHRCPFDSATTSCSSPQYQLIATNLSVNTTTGTPQNTVNTDPALAAYPDSSAAYDDAHPRSTVILSASANSGEAGELYLLGPVGLDAQQVASVQVMSEPFAGGWAVTLTLTRTGSSQWDALAQEQFHAYIAIIFDGQVISAPLVQPTQSVFSSFRGIVQIIAPNKKEADAISAVL